MAKGIAFFTMLEACRSNPQPAGAVSSLKKTWKSLCWEPRDGCLFSLEGLLPICLSYCVHKCCSVVPLLFLLFHSLLNPLLFPPTTYWAIRVLNLASTEVRGSTSIPVHAGGSLTSWNILPSYTSISRRKIRPSEFLMSSSIWCCSAKCFNKVLLALLNSSLFKKAALLSIRLKSAEQSSRGITSRV